MASSESTPKVELVLASCRGERSVAEICGEHEISETLLRHWREQMIEAGVERNQDGQDPFAPSRAAAADRRVRAPLDRKTYELEVAEKFTDVMSVV